MQEFDIEIIKIIRGEGLCKLETKYQGPKEEEGWENEVNMLKREVCYTLANVDSWYYDLKYYFTHGSSLVYLNA